MPGPLELLATLVSSADAAGGAVSERTGALLALSTPPGFSAVMASAGWLGSMTAVCLTNATIPIQTIAYTMISATRSPCLQKLGIGIPPGGAAPFDTTVSTGRTGG